MIPGSRAAEEFSLNSWKPGVSAVVVCFNEEDNIGSCLESVKWCDEIIVVDSFSTDRTLEICSRYTNRITQRLWKGYRDQLSFAISLAKEKWILVLDADERVSSELRNAIDRALASVGAEVAGFAMPRLVHYFGKWWWRGGWYPDYKTRLFRRGRASCVGLDPHPKLQVHGSVRRLRSPLYHFSYRNVADHINRVNSLTTISSAEMARHKRKWHWTDAIFRPVARFLRFYIFKKGFLEEFPGLFVAITAAYYVFLKYAKLRELELKREDETTRRPRAPDLSCPPATP
jgi:glycosyltransferase involved in cell wall biosynthesis